MIKKIILLFLIAVNFSQLQAIQITDAKVVETLNTLDYEIKNRNTYKNSLRAKIDSLKNQQYHTIQNKKNIELLLEIGNAYVAFNNDSAIAYFHQGLTKSINENHDSIATIMALKLSTYLPLAGFTTEANDIYTSIDTTTISPFLKELYYESGKQLYSYIAVFYDEYNELTKKWQAKTDSSHIGLLSSIDKKSNKYKVNMGEWYLKKKEYSKAKAILEDALTSINKNDKLYARATHTLATIALKEDNENEYIYYLAESAIADIKNSTLEVVSIQELSAKLLNTGDIKRAYSYSTIAQENAVECKARMRMAQVAKVMSIIEEAHSAEIKDRNKLINLVIISIIVLALFLLFALIYLYRDTKRLNKMRNNLKIANDTKEIYISQFLSLCSIYMDKLNQFSNIVNRKISAGKIDDLYKITKSGKFIEEQSKEFYEVFDNAFLNIYPTFIENVNDLLLPEQQITLKDEEKLNTELRILALMRLGIDDSSRIAQMLNYSINTIYTYRNKLKNKAIDRENFEKNILKIKSIG